MLLVWLVTFLLSFSVDWISCTQAQERTGSGDIHSTRRDVVNTQKHRDIHRGNPTQIVNYNRPKRLKTVSVKPIVDIDKNVSVSHHRDLLLSSRGDGFVRKQSKSEDLVGTTSRGGDIGNMTLRGDDLGRTTPVGDDLGHIVPVDGDLGHTTTRVSETWQTAPGVDVLERAKKKYDGFVYVAPEDERMAHSTRKSEYLVYTTESEDLGATTESEDLEDTTTSEDIDDTGEGEDFGDTTEGERLVHTTEGEDLGVTSEDEDLVHTTEDDDLGATSEDEDLVHTTEDEDLGGTTESKDLVRTTEGEYLVHTTEGEDLVHTTEDKDLVHTTEGEDLVHTTEGEYLVHTTGDNLIHTTEGEDLVHTTEGEDLVHTTEGDDLVHTTEDEDVSDTTEVENFDDTTEGEDLVHTTKDEDLVHTTEGEDLGDTTEGEDLVHTTEGEDLGDTTEGEDLVHTTEGEDLGDTTEGEDFVHTTKGEDLGDKTEGENIGATAEDVVVDEFYEFHKPKNLRWDLQTSFYEETVKSHMTEPSRPSFTNSSTKVKPPELDAVSTSLVSFHHEKENTVPLRNEKILPTIVTNLPLRNEKILPTIVTNLPWRNEKISPTIVTNLPLRNEKISSTIVTNLPLRNEKILPTIVTNLPLRNEKILPTIVTNLPWRNEKISPTIVTNLPLRNEKISSTIVTNLPLRNEKILPTIVTNLPLRNEKILPTIVTNLPWRNEKISPTIVTNLPLRNEKISSTIFTNLPLRNEKISSTIFTNLPLRNEKISSTIVTNLPLRNEKIFPTIVTNFPLRNEKILPTFVTNLPLRNEKILPTFVTNLPLRNEKTLPTFVTNLPLRNEKIFPTVVTNLPLRNEKIFPTVVTNLPLRNEKILPTFVTNLPLRNEKISPTIVTNLPLRNEKISPTIVTNLPLRNDKISPTIVTNLPLRNEKILLPIVTNLPLRNDKISPTIVTNLPLRNEKISLPMVTNLQKEDTVSWWTSSPTTKISDQETKSQRNMSTNEPTEKSTSSNNNEISETSEITSDTKEEIDDIVNDNMTLEGNKTKSSVAGSYRTSTKSHLRNTKTLTELNTETTNLVTKSAKETLDKDNNENINVDTGLSFSSRAVSTGFRMLQSSRCPTCSTNTNSSTEGQSSESKKEVTNVNLYDLSTSNSLGLSTERLPSSKLLPSTSKTTEKISTTGTQIKSDNLTLSSLLYTTSRLSSPLLSFSSSGKQRTAFSPSTMSPRTSPYNSQAHISQSPFTSKSHLSQSSTTSKYNLYHSPSTFKAYLTSTFSVAIPFLTTTTKTETVTSKELTSVEGSSSASSSSSVDVSTTTASLSKQTSASVRSVTSKTTFTTQQPIHTTRAKEQSTSTQHTSFGTSTSVPSFTSEIIITENTLKTTNATTLIASTTTTPITTSAYKPTSSPSIEIPTTTIVHTSTSSGTSSQEAEDLQDTWTPTTSTSSTSTVSTKQTHVTTATTSTTPPTTTFTSTTQSILELGDLCTYSHLANRDPCTVYVPYSACINDTCRCVWPKHAHHNRECVEYALIASRIEVHNVTESSATVMWSHEPFTDVQSIVYKMSWRTRDILSEDAMPRSVSIAGNNKYIIDKLVAGTEYMVTITTIIKALGNDSKQLEFYFSPVVLRTLPAQVQKMNWSLSSDQNKITITFDPIEGHYDHCIIVVRTLGLNGIPEVSNHPEKFDCIVFNLSPFETGIWHAVDVTVVSHERLGQVSTFNFTTHPSEPSPVTDLHWEAATTLVEFTWKPPLQAHGYITGYDLRLYYDGRCTKLVRLSTSTLQAQDLEKHIQTEQNVNNDRMTSVCGSQLTEYLVWSQNRSLKYEFINLVPGSQYTLQVSARNMKFAGHVTEVTFATLSAVPKSPTGAKAEVVNSSHILLMWNSPEYPGPTNYIIQVFQFLSRQKSDLNFVKNLTVHGYSTTKHMIDDLHPYSSYLFNISTLTSVGQSRSVTVGPVTTMETVSDPVNNFKITETMSESLSLLWLHPKNINGRLIAYVIFVQHENSTTTCEQVITLSAKKGTIKINQSFCSLEKHTQTNIKTSFQQTSVTYNVTALQPYVTYKISVAPYNGVGLGQISSITTSTKISVPSAPYGQKCSYPSRGTIMFSWEAPIVRAGPTIYHILVDKYRNINNHSLGSDIIGNFTMPESSNRTITVGGLNDFWMYSFSMSAQTSAGRSETVKLFPPCQTPSSAPGPLQDLHILSVNVTSARIHWDCPVDENKHGVIEMFQVYQRPRIFNRFDLDQNFVQDQTFKVDAGSRPCTGPYSMTVTVIPEVTYIFQIQAKVVGVDQLGEMQSQVFTGPAAVPVSINTLPTSEPYTDESSLKESSFSLNICGSCLLDNSHGQVSAVGILICQEGFCDHSLRDLHDWKTFYTGLATWKTAQSMQFETIYRPTNKSWELELQAWTAANAGNDVIFEVGNDTSCVSKPDSIYCNGPVPAGKSFRVRLFACTNAGCTVSEPSGLFMTAESHSQPSSDIVVIGGAVAGVAVAIVVIAIVIGVKLRFRDPKVKEVSSPFVRKKDLPQVIVMTDIPSDCTDDSYRPIKIEEYEKTLRQLHMRDNALLAQEYVELNQQSPQHSIDVGSDLAYRHDNRWTNILPYDHSRVKLTSHTGGEAFSHDYINANYIPGIASSHDYIATQGPLTRTVPDFWRMVWEQNVSVIIMLSDFEELDKRTQMMREKVARYFPQDEQSYSCQYGLIQVTRTAKVDSKQWEIRTLHLTHMQTRKVRILKHFFFKRWSDHEADINPKDLIDFVEVLKAETSSLPQAPLVVHCSAGVGRTGTFIAVDYFHKYLTAMKQVSDKQGLASVTNRTVDIFSRVLKMRNNRRFMVQTLTQYIFIYDTVQEIIRRVLQIQPLRDSRCKELDLPPGMTFYQGSLEDAVYDDVELLQGQVCVADRSHETLPV